MRFVVLDAYDLSLLDSAQGPDHPLRIRADEIMAVNPNPNKHSPEGLEGLNKRFVEFGGGVGDAQLAWLEGQLADARARGQRAVVAGHIPFCPGTAPEPCLLWNHDAVCRALEASGVVVATLAGHAHMNGYALRNGIHHVVLPSILETPPERDAFAVADVLPHALVLRGRDTCMSLVLRFAGEGGEPLGAPHPLAALAPWAVALEGAVAAVGAGAGRLKGGGAAAVAAVADERVAVAARA